jgi:tetrahydromethanopterin S-methyltransferase subunit F
MQALLVVNSAIYSVKYTETFAGQRIEFRKPIGFQGFATGFSFGIVVTIVLPALALANPVCFSRFLMP